MEIEKRSCSILCGKSSNIGGDASRVAISGLAISDVDQRRRIRQRMCENPPLEELLGVSERRTHRSASAVYGVKPYGKLECLLNKPTSSVRYLLLQVVKEDWVK